MKDNEILFVSMIVAASGLLILFFISDQIQPTLQDISDISNEDAGSKVIVKGTVASMKVHEDGHVFLEIKDATGTIDAVLFEGMVEEAGGLETIQGCTVMEVTGRIDEYRGALEIIPRGGGDVKCLSF
jgi:DNA/RNA endonuclease YhcR with UshA esterase domain